jgi:outer membrane protein insertion porin family
MRHLLRVVSCLALLALSRPLLAQQPVVRAVQVEGLLRVAAESVTGLSQVALNSPLDPDALSRSIERIWATGFFDDVRALARPNADGVTLVYAVKERPAIHEVRIEGQDAVELEDLQKGIHLKPFSILDRRKILEAVANTRKKYREEGYFLARVEPELVPVQNNLVDVVFRITEGNKVKVKSLELVGNRQVPDDDVKPYLNTKEAGYFSFLTESGKYQEETFQQDLEIIREYYLTKGFVNVAVGQPVVSLDRAKDTMYISVPVNEGESFNVGEVGLDGDLIEVTPQVRKKLKLKSDDPEALKAAIRANFKLKKGEVFNSMNVRDDTLYLNHLYQDQGFAFASVSNANTLHPQERVIDFSYVVQKGDKYKVGRIEMTGNEKTADKVIRRELEIHEGDEYSLSLVEESEKRVQRLGYLEEVHIDSRRSPEPGFVDLLVHVKEKDTGSFQLGAGFSSLENFVFTAQVSKYNFLGRGQTITFQMILSGLRSIFNVQFFEPYFFDTDLTFSLNVYDYSQDYSDFTKESTGGDVGLGYRITRDLILSLYYRFEHVRTTMGGYSNRSTVPLSRIFGQGITSSVQLDLTYDTRDNVIFPTQGQMTSASVEHAAGYTGSDTEFTRALFRTRWFFPVFWKVVAKFNGTLGYIYSQDPDGVPIYERFLVGGIFTVRGFQRNSLGPYLNVARVYTPDSSLTRFVVGGNKELIFNSELEFPILDQVGIKGVLFFDAGQAFNESETIDLLRLRTSVGFGIRWWSPVGPLRFEWGFPLKPQKGEDSIVFEFTIGNPF